MNDYVCVCVCVLGEVEERGLEVKGEEYETAGNQVER